MRTGFAISSFCLNDMPLEMALDRLSTLTDSVEIMDEGCHRLEDTAVLETFDLRYMVHAPSRGVNLASLLEPVRRASVEVTVACLALSTEVGAPVVVHPDISPGRGIESGPSSSSGYRSRSSSGLLRISRPRSTSRTWATGSTFSSRPRTSCR